jgi:hypothetical protein
MRLIVFAAVALVASGPLAAADTVAPAAVQSAKPVKICRKVENTTGSHLTGSGRVCRTAEQWAKYDNADNVRNAGSNVEKRSTED